MNHLQFLRALLILNGIVPTLVLGWDAYHGQLGANSVNYALHVTGILSLVFLFLSLSVTPLRWLTGWSGWISLRRALGLFGFYYAVVHVAIYVGLDRELSIASTVSEIWLRRFLQVGTAAIFLMVPLAVTSTDTMIRRIGPKRWKQIHKLAYVATALGVTHYFLLVKSDVRQPVAFAVVLAGLLGARFGRRYFESLLKSKSSNIASHQRSRPWKGELQVESITQVTHDVKTFRLRKPTTGTVNEVLPFDYLPGQFLNLQLTIDGQRIHRCYSLASSPTLEDACELTIKRDPNGLASRYLHDKIGVGELLKVVAPAGKFAFTGTDPKGTDPKGVESKLRVPTDVLLIAGGVGITPLMSIARYLTDRAWKGQIHFVVVARSERDIIFYDELLSLQQRHRNFKLCIALTQASPDSKWRGHRGFLNEALLRGLVELQGPLPVYLCGPKGMMQATRELLLECGASESLIHTEEFVSPRASVFSEETASDEVRTSRITFSRSKVDADCDASMSVLEAAEQASLELPFECRSGICGQCKTRMLTGSVQMDSEDALTQAEKAEGWILACQAHPQSDLVIDA